MKIANPARRIEYILEADRGNEAQTVFTLRRLSWEEFADVQSSVPVTSQAAVRIAQLTADARAEGRSMTPEELAVLTEEVPDWISVSTQMTRMHAAACRRGLDSIRGLLDHSGKPIEMSAEDFARWAPIEIVQELGNEILRLSTLTETDQKN